MTKRILLRFVVVFVICINVYADEIPLNPTRPDQYRVIKNDTLWEIAGKFLKHPWQWPVLLKTNDKIKAPNLIYPGDIITLTILNEKPKISLLEEKQHDEYVDQSTCILEDNNAKRGRSEFSVSKEGKLTPCIRKFLVKQAVDFIPYEKIAAFLNQSKVASDNKLTSVAFVVDIASDHLMAGVGDTLYANGLNQSENKNYSIYRKGDSYISPDSPEVLGYDLRYIADVTVQKFAEASTLIITKSNSEVLYGDLVLPKTDEEFTLSYFPKPPQIKVSANIIRVFGGISQIGALGIVAIDKGAQDGISEGHVLTIVKNDGRIKNSYQYNNNDMVKLPDEQVGALMIFRVFERVSYALVTRSTQDIHLLDKVMTP
jgi:hypothetical protein